MIGNPKANTSVSDDTGHRSVLESTRLVALPHPADALLAEKVPISALHLTGSPRLEGADPAHIAVLADLESEVPPILVHRKTMRVIDGVHRVRAAVLNGQTDISAMFFEGSDEHAFILAVESNVRHGLPLSLDDRRAAALRIMTANPELSNRAIAASTGLAAKTVNAIRVRATAHIPQLNIRLGVDGRVRPIDNTTRREQAWQFLQDHPNASLRDIAKAARISPGTARDVRDRVRRGENPTARRQPSRGDVGQHQDASHGHLPKKPAPVVDEVAILRSLRNDPSLRLTESGRALLRWLHGHAVEIERLSALIDAVPPHCSATVAQLAAHYAAVWNELSTLLERRERAMP